MDLHVVKAFKCLKWVLPALCFHSSGSFSFRLRSLLPFSFDWEVEEGHGAEADAFTNEAAVLFADSTVSANLLYAPSRQSLADQPVLALV